MTRSGPNRAAFESPLVDQATAPTQGAKDRPGPRRLRPEIGVSEGISDVQVGAGSSLLDLARSGASRRAGRTPSRGPGAGRGRWGLQHPFPIDRTRRLKRVLVVAIEAPGCASGTSRTTGRPSDVKPCWARKPERKIWTPYGPPRRAVGTAVGPQWQPPGTGPAVGLDLRIPGLLSLPRPRGRHPWLAGPSLTRRATGATLHPMVVVSAGSG